MSSPRVLKDSLQIVCLLTVLSIFPPGLSADTIASINWAGGSSVWNDTTKWSCAVCGSPTAPNNGNLGLDFQTTIDSGQGDSVNLWFLNLGVSSLTIGGHGASAPSALNITNNASGFFYLDSLNVRDGGSLNLGAGTTVKMYPVAAGNSPQIANQGTVAVGDGATWQFTNTGDLTLVNNGSIQLQSQSSGTTFAFAPLDHGKTLTLSGSGSLTGTQSAVSGVDNLITTTDGTSQLVNDVGHTLGGNLHIGNFSSFTNNGVINSSGAVIVDLLPGPSQTSDGAFSNNGTIDIGGQLSVYGRSDKTIQNNGTLSLNGGTLSLLGSDISMAYTLAGNGVQMMNASLNGGSLQNGPLPSVLNNSTIAGSGVIGQLSGLTNNGTLQALYSGQTLAVNTGLSNWDGTTNTLTAGNYEADDGAVLRLSGIGSDANVNLSLARVTLSGSGMISGDGTTNALSRLSGLDGSFLVLNGATLSTNPGGNNGALPMTHGMISLNASTLQIAGGLNDAGTLDLESGSLLTIGGTLHNLGQSIVLDAGNTVMAGAIDNQGSITLNGGTILAGAGGVANAAQKSIQLNAVNGVGSTFTSTGALSNGTQSSVRLTGGGNALSAYGLTNQGTLVIGAGDTADFRSGAFTNLNSATGALTGGTYEVAGRMIFDGGPILQIGRGATLKLDAAGGDTSGLFYGSSQADALAPLNRLSGTLWMARDSPVLSSSITRSLAPSGGTLTIDPGGLVLIGNASVANATINVAGGIDNNGSIALRGDTSGLNVSGGFVNAGIISSSGANPFINASSFYNAGGTVFVNYSALDLRSGGPQGNATGTFLNLNGAGVLSGGIFNVESGTLLFDASSGPGGGHITTIAADASLILYEGQLRFGPGAGSDALSGLSQVDGTLQVGHETLAAGNAGLTVGVVGQFNIDGDENVMLDGFVSVTTGNQTTLNGSLINHGVTDVFASAIFTVNGNVTSDGTFLQTGGSVLQINSGEFSNAGMVSLSGGSSLLGNYVQTAGSTTIAADGSYIGANVLLDGGTLSGGGLITGDLMVDGGTVSPGDAQTLSVDGSYVQTLTGMLGLDIFGESSYDQVAIGGDVTLNGTLNLTLENGFDAGIGTLFHVMTWGGSGTGDFAVFNNVSFDDGTRTFAEAFTSNGLDLVVVDSLTAAPEPYTFALVAAGLLAAVTFRRT